MYAVPEYKALPLTLCNCGQKFPNTMLFYEV